MQLQLNTAQETFLRWRVSQGLVRFYADYQIKQHISPCVKTLVDSFKFQSCDRTLQAECLTRLLFLPALYNAN